MVRKAGSELAGVLADVSGKGVPAALLASLVQGALHMESAASGRCDTALERISELLCRKALPDRFVTMFATVLNAQGQGHYVSAGHNPTFLYRAATKQIEELPSGRLVLGAFPFASNNSTALHPGAGAQAAGSHGSIHPRHAPDR